MTDAYAKAGVDQGAADTAVAGLVRALGAIELGRPSPQVPLPGHYASVIRIGENRDRPLDRRRRDQAGGRRGARAARHGRDRLRGDERQRRDLRRRRAAGDARLHRGRPGRPGGLRADRHRPRPRGGRWPGSRSPAASSPSSATWSAASTSPAPASAPSRSTRSSTARRSGRRRRHRPPLLRAPLQRLHPGPLGAGGLDLDEDPEGRLGRPLGDACSSRPRSTSSRWSSCCAPRSRSAASPTSPPAAPATCCGWPPRSATRSTSRCRSRRSST